MENKPSMSDENHITFLIRKAIFNVYNNLGPGLLESAYAAALQYELRKLNLKVVCQVPMPLIYENVKLEVGYRLDLVVENKVVVEIKSVETLLNVHFKQLITYLKLSKLKVGILVNFNTDDIKNSIHRKVYGFY